MKTESCIVAVFFFFALLAPVFSGEIVKESSCSLNKTTAMGMFHVEFKLHKEKLSVGKNTADLTVMDKDKRPLTGARLTIRPHVARHGETSLIKPSVTEKGDGVYHAENIYIDTPGDWELKVTVRQDDVEDSAVFDFPGVKRQE